MKDTTTGYVIYEPLLNGYGSPYDKFSFVAFDGIAESETVTVPIEVTPDLALGMDAEVTLDASADIDVTKPFTFEAWVKKTSTGY